LNGNACEKLKEMENETKSLNKLKIEKEKVEFGDNIFFISFNWLSQKTVKAREEYVQVSLFPGKG
jgi:hypothetical protein